MFTSAVPFLVAAPFSVPATGRNKPVTPASQLRQALFDLTSEAIVLAARTYNAFLRPEHIFRSKIEGLQPIDKAFATSLGCTVEVVATVQRLPDGRVTSLITPQLVPAGSVPTVALEADFAANQVSSNGPAALVDIEVEIYLRTDEDRLIDLLDFSEISEEADEDEYVVGYVALAHLLRHQDILRKYGAFIMRTGRLRLVNADEYFAEEAA